LFKIVVFNKEKQQEIVLFQNFMHLSNIRTKSNILEASGISALK